ncbi:MAG: hypothetical protein JSR48_11795 [Verrucomicrobia bacterium]|nr:hypothetical protein [Verrucomicrobiota bacterium]
MNRVPTIALVGDPSPAVTAHRAIPVALALAADAERVMVQWRWYPTAALHEPARQLADSAALWVVPGSPYANLDGVLGAIRWARESRRPTLGSCGGFQHLLIEFARSCAGIRDADHAETNPSGADLVVAPLSCSLVEKTGEVSFAPGSVIRSIYGRDAAVEGYHCNYGLNPAYRVRLESAGLRFPSQDGSGDVRSAELAPAIHPLFIGTLFQSERAALRGEIPPLARALVRAATGVFP